MYLFSFERCLRVPVVYRILKKDGLKIHQKKRDVTEKKKRKKGGREKERKGEEGRKEGKKEGRIFSRGILKKGN